MKKERLIEIGQKIIYTAGVFSEVKDENKKSELLKIFYKFEEELKNDSTKYSKTLLGFINDLRNDLNSGRELKIDSSMADDYLSNYFISNRELRYYNLLINEESFNLLFWELSKKNIDKSMIKKYVGIIEKDFIENIKKLSVKNISENLLIITLSERNLVLPSLKRIYYFLYKKDVLFSKELEIIIKLINIFKKFLYDIKTLGFKNYESKSYNYKYLRYTKNDRKLNLDLKISDSSKEKFRTGNPDFEYLNLLKKI